MRDVWVVNASPVITLAKAGHLVLLTEMADEILLPEAVAAELLMASAEDPARQAVVGGWGTRIACDRDASHGARMGTGCRRNGRAGSCSDTRRLYSSV